MLSLVLFSTARLTATLNTQSFAFSLSSLQMSLGGQIHSANPNTLLYCAILSRCTLGERRITKVPQIPPLLRIPSEFHPERRAKKHSRSNLCEFRHYPTTPRKFRMQRKLLHRPTPKKDSERIHISVSARRHATPSTLPNLIPGTLLPLSRHHKLKSHNSKEIYSTPSHRTTSTTTNSKPAIAPAIVDPLTHCHYLLLLPLFPPLLPARDGEGSMPSTFSSKTMTPEVQSIQAPLSVAILHRIAPEKKQLQAQEANISGEASGCNKFHSYRSDAATNDRNAPECPDTQPAIAASTKSFKASWIPDRYHLR